MNKKIIFGVSIFIAFYITWLFLPFVKYQSNSHANRSYSFTVNYNAKKLNLDTLKRIGNTNFIISKISKYKEKYLVFEPTSRVRPGNYIPFYNEMTKKKCLKFDVFIPSHKKYPDLDSFQNEINKYLDDLYVGINVKFQNFREYETDRHEHLSDFNVDEYHKWFFEDMLDVKKFQLFSKNILIIDPDYIFRPEENLAAFYKFPKKGLNFISGTEEIIQFPTILAHELMHLTYDLDHFDCPINYHTDTIYNIMDNCFSSAYHGLTLKQIVNEVNPTFDKYKFGEKYITYIKESRDPEFHNCCEQIDTIKEIPSCNYDAILEECVVQAISSTVCANDSCYIDMDLVFDESLVINNFEMLVSLLYPEIELSQRRRIVNKKVNLYRKFKKDRISKRLIGYAKTFTIPSPNFDDAMHNSETLDSLIKFIKTNTSNSEFISYTGTILDLKQNPIEGIQVTYQQANNEWKANNITTNINGNFYFQESIALKAIKLQTESFDTIITTILQNFGKISLPVLQSPNHASDSLLISGIVYSNSSDNPIDSVMLKVDDYDREYSYETNEKGEFKLTVHKSFRGISFCHSNYLGISITSDFFKNCNYSDCEIDLQNEVTVGCHNNRI